MSNSDVQALLSAEETDAPVQAHPRHTYHRMSTSDSMSFNFDTFEPFNFENAQEPHNDQTASNLGIAENRMADSQVPKRVPVRSRASRSPPTPSPPTFTPTSSGGSPMQTTSAENSPGLHQVPGSSKPLLSPRFPRFEGGGSQSGLNIMREEDDISRGRPLSSDARDDDRISMNNVNDNAGRFWTYVPGTMMRSD
jgi:hypothetical protein